MFRDREKTIRLTPKWTGKRLPDGRPYVSDDVLERMRKLNYEEVWMPLEEEFGYRFLHECNFRIVHPERKMVGRALTVVMVPEREDLCDAITAIGEEEGYTGYYNQWVIDNVSEGDVVVVDFYDKIYKGTYVGGNLTTAISKHSKTGGAVIWGGIRDLEQIEKIENEKINVFYRGIDPTGIGETCMVGFNDPCRIGRAICMPGDVVFGTASGVIFVPPHLAEIVVAKAEKIRIKDVFGFQRLSESKYTTAQIDKPWTKDIWMDFMDWFNNSEYASKFAYLDWSEDIEKAK
jgi:regulator of RNase E activity RraA